MRTGLRKERECRSLTDQSDATDQTGCWEGRVRGREGVAVKQDIEHSLSNTAEFVDSGTS
jgi:hypothetical protein